MGDAQKVTMDQKQIDLQNKKRLIQQQQQKKSGTSLLSEFLQNFTYRFSHTAFFPRCTL